MSYDLIKGQDTAGKKKEWIELAGSHSWTNRDNTASKNELAVNIQPEGAALSINADGDMPDYTPPCGFPTKENGEPCSLPGTRDGRCHHHEGMVEDCGFPTKSGDPCQLPGHQNGRCHLHHGQCNESFDHDNAEKMVFHGMKGAFRAISSGYKGILDDGYDVDTAEHAARVAQHIGAILLKAMGEEYVPDKSRPHYERNVADQVETPQGRENGFIWGGKEPTDKEMEEYYVQVLEKGIEKAWKKIDGGNHVGGARVAIAAAEHYFQERIEVEPPEGDEGILGSIFG